MKSVVCRYFFQNVKKTDLKFETLSLKWCNGRLFFLSAQFHFHYESTVASLSLMSNGMVFLIESVLCFLHIACIFHHETGF